MDLIFNTMLLLTRLLDVFLEEKLLNLGFIRNNKLQPIIKKNERKKIYNEMCVKGDAN